MKRQIIAAATLAIIAGMGGLDVTGHERGRFYDLHKNAVIDTRQTVKDLAGKRIILVGEHHTVESHHQAQLEVIRILNEAGVEVAVGLEMFRSDSQDSLDRWLNGEMDDGTFQRIYYDNWNYPWPLYKDIFEYARNHEIPLVGLNVPRDITRQVSRSGYQSLSDEQRRRLGDVACRVDKEYMDYIRKAYGGHGHGNMNFVYFCEAQMVWDNAMAVSSLEYLKANPDRVMVILAGTGHVRKQAIPYQIRSRSSVAMAVILPEVSGRIDAKTVDTGDADYIFLDLN